MLLPALLFGFAYLTLAAFVNPGLMTSKLIDEPNLSSQWLQYTFANLAPLPDTGLLKALRGNLFGENGQASLISVAALAMETLQKLLALIGYFLMGLALRNLFKMK